LPSGFYKLIKVYGFKVFGWYRIIAGIILLILLDRRYPGEKHCNTNDYF
jgi:hypothetical protein